MTMVGYGGRSAKPYHYRSMNESASEVCSGIVMNALAYDAAGFAVDPNQRRRGVASRGKQGAARCRNLGLPDCLFFMIPFGIRACVLVAGLPVSKKPLIVRLLVEFPVRATHTGPHAGSLSYSRSRRVLRPTTVSVLRDRLPVARAQGKNNSYDVLVIHAFGRSCDFVSRAMDREHELLALKSRRNVPVSVARFSWTVSRHAVRLLAGRR
jgi:hypothetical protein